MSYNESVPELAEGRTFFHPCLFFFIAVAVSFLYCFKLIGRSYAAYINILYIFLQIVRRSAAILNKYTLNINCNKAA